MSTTPTSESSAAQIAAVSTTLCEAFQATAQRRGDATALRTPEGQEISWREYAQRVRDIAAGLAAYGIGRGDTVAMMLANRPEGHIVDTAALHLGATPFSIYNTFAHAQLDYVLDHSDATLIVTERAFVDRVLEVQKGRPRLKHVFVIDDPVEGTAGVDALASAGRPDFNFEATWSGVTPEDVATLIYTSGTTGPPKGVELTHDNVVWTGRAWLEVTKIGFDGQLMSYLPMAHAADRAVAHYFGMLTGGCITCVADPKAAVPAIAGCQPTLWLGVPRVWEKLMAALEAKIGAPPFSEQTAAAVRAQLGFPEGGFLLSGAASLPLHVMEFFDALGLPVNEGYGMTECSAVTTMNHAGARRVGTVGRALPGVELSVADDGELIVRGPLVMRGYRKDPEQTAAVIDKDGWFSTGDIVEIDDGFVTLVDRKKEIIVNTAGKNMSPSNIESQLKAASSLIGTTVAIGDSRAYNTALIVLEPEAVQAWAEQRGIAADALADIAAHPDLVAEIDAAVERANTQLARVEQIKRHTLLPVEWLPGGDELTPTLKLKRRPIAEKYASEIDAMYTQSG